MTIYDSFEAFQRAEDERMVRTIRGLCKAAATPMDDRDAETIAAAAYTIVDHLEGMEPKPVVVHVAGEL